MARPRPAVHVAAGAAGLARVALSAFARATPRPEVQQITTSSGTSSARRGVGHRRMGDQDPDCFRIRCRSRTVRRRVRHRGIRRPGPVVKSLAGAARRRRAQKAGEAAARPAVQAPTTIASPALRRGFDLPAAGAAYVPNEVILDIAATVPTQTLDRHRGAARNDASGDPGLPSHRPHAASLAHRRCYLGAGHGPQHRGRTPGRRARAQLHLSVGRAVAA